MKKLFGTDGMRGEAGRFPLDGATIRTAGRSLARHLAARTDRGRESHIIVGRDTRESGPWLEESLIAGALEAGARCESAGVITTPGVAYLTYALAADAGVVISASHNPYQDNGIKIFAPTGRKLDDAMERLIEADIASAQNGSSVEDGPDVVPRQDNGERSAELTKRYVDHLAEDVAAGLSLKGLSLVVDCANGAASHLAPPLFTRLGAHVIPINVSPDGRNINKDCGSLYIDPLRQQVVRAGSDLGVAFDGDADRALFVDARGEYIDGDATLWAMAKHMVSRDELAHNIVVATVMSNIGLELALRSRGIQLVRADVGDKYVLEELLRTNASLGGEQSGHIIFPRRSLVGDGMMTALYLLRVMLETGARLHELTEGFTRYPQVLVNVRVREKRPFEEVSEVALTAKEVMAELGETGRLLLRYSGTEPLARVMVEGKHQNEVDRHANRLAMVIKKEIGVN